MMSVHWISTGMAQVYEPCSVVNAAGFTVCPAPDFALLFLLRLL